MTYIIGLGETVMADRVHVHPLNEEEQFCLEGCGSYKQYHHMRHGFESDICQFCTLDPAINFVLWEDESATCWSVHPNFKRTELAHHLIVIPKRHVRYPWELKVHEVLSMQGARIYLSHEFDLAGGIMATRFGDMRLNAGTVPHLHENIMVPNGTGEVRIPVFKDPKDREANKIRAAEFALRYEANEIP